jgi:hypothetical protein
MCNGQFDETICFGRRDTPRSARRARPSSARAAGLYRNSPLDVPTADRCAGHFSVRRTPVGVGIERRGDIEQGHHVVLVDYAAPRERPSRGVSSHGPSAVASYLTGIHATSGPCVGHDRTLESIGRSRGNRMRGDPDFAGCIPRSLAAMAMRRSARLVVRGVARHDSACVTAVRCVVESWLTVFPRSWLTL